MPLHSEFKKAWLEDLRSGKFKQGRMRLKTAEGHYCCLGVALESAKRIGLLSFREREIDLEQNIHPAFYIQGLTTDEVFADTMPPDFVLNLIGLSEEAADDLAQDNDDRRLTFEQIAEKIEQERFVEEPAKVVEEQDEEAYFDEEDEAL